ncbi:hypothetical protein [Chromobacterium sp. IIBBL 290-4]|uniref:hypothetical protein n=1 Tax=Chromobacterium sp. IIBBL 290-4 TaxID=2953890 RepID=UPI0020B8344E|nr:hypothetical protein [Chromobacterium sp. IIBBL 290-4]UTH76101.1 hypothetical protein NKT35_08365 [Chromobacterium sp. IIBBL 290-4]
MPDILTTPHLNLPLPHPANSLAEDVLRIRDAFSALDQKIAGLDALLASDDLNLDTLQELVAAIKRERGDLDQAAAQLLEHKNAVNARMAEHDARLTNLAALACAGL